MQRVLSIPQAIRTSRMLRAEGKRVVLIGGCFDVLHLGHIRFIAEAKKQGDFLFVMLESDEKIRKLKGDARPIHTQSVRAAILASLRDVDYVIRLAYFARDHDYEQLVKKIQPAIIAATRRDGSNVYKKRIAKKVGASMRYVIRRILDHSTTQTIHTIQARKKEL